VTAFAWGYADIAAKHLPMLDDTNDNALASSSMRFSPVALPPQERDIRSFLQPGRII
jgi:hypothetical protein